MTSTVTQTQPPTAPGWPDRPEGPPRGSENRPARIEEVRRGLLRLNAAKHLVTGAIFDLHGDNSPHLEVSGELEGLPDAFEQALYPTMESVFREFPEIESMVFAGGPPPQGGKYD